MKRLFDIHDAIADPERVFETPENLVSDPRLDRETKLHLLREWMAKDDVRSSGDGAGDNGGRATLYRRIRRAVSLLSRRRGPSEEPD